MPGYLISPPTYTDLKIEHDQFLAALKLQYPDAIVTVKTGTRATRYYADFSMQTTCGLVMGSISQAGQTVVVDGELSDCATVAVWVRSLVHLDYSLIFYEDNLTSQIELTTATTVEEVVAAFL